MHLGYTGPKHLNIDSEGYPIRPYGVEDNPESILDVSDIVFVNPVNVGFSRIIGDADRSQFFGVREDLVMSYIEQPAGSFPNGFEISGKVEGPYLRVDFDVVLAPA